MTKMTAAQRLCALLGHKMPRGYGRGTPYAKQPHSWIWTDGIGRGHVHLYVECPRCKQEWSPLSFHPPQAWIDGDKASRAAHLAAQIEGADDAG